MGGRRLGNAPYSPTALSTFFFFCKQNGGGIFALTPAHVLCTYLSYLADGATQKTERAHVCMYVECTYVSYLADGVRQQTERAAKKKRNAFFYFPTATTTSMYSSSLSTTFLQVEYTTIIMWFSWSKRQVLGLVYLYHHSSFSS